MSAPPIPDNVVSGLGVRGAGRGYFSRSIPFSKGGGGGLNWRSGSDLGGFSVARAGAASVFDSSGALTAVAANQPRFTYSGYSDERLGLLIEEAETNYAASDMAGAVVGVVGSGGALPTGWHTTNGGASATIEIVAVSGSRARLRFTGTTVATLLLQMASTTAVTVAAGEAWSTGYRLRLVSGTMPSAAGIGVVERNAAGGFVGTYSVNVTPQADILFQEEFNHTVVSGARLCPLFSYSGSASPYDFTVDIEAVQLIKKARIGSFIAAASGSTATRNADDVTQTTALRGLVIDADASRESRTGTLFQYDDGTNSNRIELALDASMLKLNVSVGGVVTSADLGLWVPMMRGRVALSINGASVSAAYDGKDAVTVAALPTGLTTAKMGRGAAGYWNATIGRFRPTAPMDAAALKTASVYGLFDDFARANNASLGSAITGQTYVQFDPTVNANTDIVKMAISGNKATTAASGNTSTFSYSAVDMGATIGAMGVAFSHTSTSPGATTLIGANGATGSVVNDILANSSHPNFRGPQSAGITAQIWAAGAVTSYGGGAYQSAIAANTIYFDVAKFTNNAVICRGFDGRLQRGANAGFAATRSRYGIFEASRGNTSDTLSAFSALKIDLAAA